MRPNVDASFSVLIIFNRYLYDNIRLMSFIFKAMDHGLIDVKDKSSFDAWLQWRKIDRLFLFISILIRSHMV